LEDKFSFVADGGEVIGHVSELIDLVGGQEPCFACCVCVVSFHEEFHSVNGIDTIEVYRFHFYWKDTGIAGRVGYDFVRVGSTAQDG